jgi:hypothetical protein
MDERRACAGGLDADGMTSGVAGNSFESQLVVVVRGLMMIIETAHSFCVLVRGDPVVVFRMIVLYVVMDVQG